MSTKHDLKHSILTILKHNKDGSQSTQANRKARLLMLAEQLLAQGFYLRTIHQLKPKHIYRTLELWKQQGMKPGTIKNRMTDIRWLSEKINRPGLVPASNDKLHISRREYVTNKDKSIVISEGDLSKITDPDVRMSLLLQKKFGLRREESIKIRIHQAVQGNKLCLQGPWCKNGKPREVEIRYPEQWAAIEKCKAYVERFDRALIPDDKSYYQQMKRYENQLAAVGIHKAHGLRYPNLNKIQTFCKSA